MSRSVTEIPKTARSTITSVLPFLPQTLRAAVKTLSKKAPFSDTLRRSIGAYWGMEYSCHAPVRFFLARQHQLAYLQIPKVACTSIKTTLYRLNYPETAEDKLAGKLKIHSNPEWEDMLSDGSPELSSFFRFTFVRNPYARFVSFYWSKIVGKDGNGPVRRFRELGYTPGTTIDDVLDLVEGTPPPLLDHHLLPQSAFLLRDGRLQVDFIGRLERFSHDLNLVEARTGTTLQMGHLNRTKNTRPEDAGRILTNEQKHRIARLYAKDFELLGYEI